MNHSRWSHVRARRAVDEEAVARHREALDLLAEMDRVYGPLTEEDLERVQGLWPREDRS